MKRHSLLLTLALALLPSSWGAEVQTVSDFPTHEVPAQRAAVLPDAPARNIILMIGDGMGSEHVWAAWICNKGKLNIERLPVVGFSRTLSASHAITDSAAGGTALACGSRTSNGTVGQSATGAPFASFAETQRAKGVATGLVVTKTITDATPAAFYAHAASRRETAKIASQLAPAGFDVVLGGGSGDVPADQVDAMRQSGTLVELSAPRHLAPATKRGDYLPKAVARALSRLEKSEKGFFLMVEGSQIDTAAHANDLREVVAETLDFDQAIGVVLNWMETHPDTLLIVTADHQTGGLSLVGADVAAGRVSGCFTTRGHSGVTVPVYAAGAQAQRVSGIFDNTGVHAIMEAADKASRPASAPAPAPAPEPAPAEIPAA